MTEVPEQLLITGRVNLAIQLGEGHFREFKSAWDRSKTPPIPRTSKEIARDVAETLVGFANADGGELLVGVEDDGRITGVPHLGQELETILRPPRTHILNSTPLTGFRVATAQIDSFQIVYFQIPKGTTQIHQTSDGRCLQRLSTENRPVPLEHIRYERIERRSREYDREYVDGATLIDLDSSLLEKAVERIMPGASIDRCLQYLDLLTYDGGLARLRRAALLLFARDINRWHPRSQVRVVRVLGNKLEVGPEYNVHRDDVIQGNTLTLIEEAWTSLRVHLAVERLAEGAVFRESILYPEVACREAIVNAIVHRDYSAEGSGIEILVFNDRMEIVSPGSLLSDVSLEALRRREKVHQSRNAYIARVLRELGYVREMGEGIPRIFNVLELHDLVPPELIATPHAFSIILHHRSVFSPKDRAWLESFRGIPLSRDEQRVLLLARDRGVVSPSEIMTILGIVDTAAYAELVDRMQWKGLLISTMTKAEIITELRRQRKLGTSRERREIARLSVRDPQECVALVEELLRAVWRAGVPTAAHPSGVYSIMSQLSEDSPFRRNLVAALLSLELIDEERRPTARLLELLSRIKPEPTLVKHPSKIVKAEARLANGKLHSPATQLDSLIQEVSKIIAVSRREDGGAPLRLIQAKLSDGAKAIVRSLGREGNFVDFLSRQQDEFTLRWVRNTWVVYKKKI